MTPRRVFFELDNFLTLLLRSEVAILTTKVILQHGSPGIQRITWAKNKVAPGELFRNTSPTVLEYREWIDKQGYSAVLFDGSILQISYDFENSELAGHRLLYFPCPFDFDQELLEVFALVDVIDFYRDHETANVRLRSPLRFDYQPDTNLESHPNSHMTFQWSHTRVPVMAPISPGHFIHFVFKNFYPTMWEVHDFLQEWPKHEFESTITHDQQRTLHFCSVAQ